MSPELATPVRRQMLLKYYFGTCAALYCGDFATSVRSLPVALNRHRTEVSVHLWDRLLAVDFVWKPSAGSECIEPRQNGLACVIAEAARVFLLGMYLNEEVINRTVSEIGETELVIEFDADGVVSESNRLTNRRTYRHAA